MTQQAIDPAAAKNAYDMILPRAQAMPVDERVSNRVDIQDAVIVALGVVERLRQPEMRARFVGLPASVFDPVHLDELPMLTLATYHCLVELEGARAVASEARLPAELVAEAGEVKGRMLALCDYVFRNDPQLSAEVANIRAGVGYKDLALDLMRLAKLYEGHEARLALDPFTYRATDLAEARRLSQAILGALSRGPGSAKRVQQDIMNAIWTLFAQCYGEVQVTGRYLYRHENGDALFPSLYRCRARRARTGSAPASDTDAGAPA